MKAAETAGTKVIGVDVDNLLNPNSNHIRYEELSKSVYDAIDEYYRGTFEIGTAVTLDVKLITFNYQWNFRFQSSQEHNDIYNNCRRPKLIKTREKRSRSPTNTKVDLFTALTI